MAVQLLLEIVIVHNFIVFEFVITLACESRSNFIFEINNIMECKYNKNNDKCTNHHNKTGYCRFITNGQLNNCYYNPNSYQFRNNK